MAIKSGHSFPASFGFTNSCGGGGMKSVRGYQRGGRVTVPPAKSVDKAKNVPNRVSTQQAPKQPRQPPTPTPRGALQQRGALMPGYAEGGVVNKREPFKRGGCS